jgi:hypothetical protein
MRRLGWACLLGGAVACGNTDPVTGSPNNNSDEEGEQYVRPDGGRDSGSPGSRDGGTPRADAATPPRDSGFAECADTRVDAEKKPASVNVVWVIDTSGSMDQEAAAVQQNINRFAQQIVGAGLTDYRVVVVSERDFISVPDPLGSDAAHFLHIEERVGSDEPLSALLGRFGDYADFLIDNTLTHFIAVTDDESEISAQEFQTQMGTNLGGDPFIVNAIASPPGESSTTIFGISIGACTGQYGSAARAGEVYWQAAEATGGLTFSICSGDWSALVDQLAKAVGESAAVPCSLELPTPPQGQELDYDRVNVVLGDDAVPRVDGEDACGSKAGWYWDNPGSPTGIRLCTTSCDAAENGGSLQVAIGCTTIVQ